MMDGGPNMSVCRLQPREFCSWWWVTVVFAILKKRTLFLTGGLNVKLHIDLNCVYMVIYISMQKEMIYYRCVLVVSSVSALLTPAFITCTYSSCLDLRRIGKNQL